LVFLQESKPVQSGHDKLLSEANVHVMSQWF
jgi:hypothetical protein